MKIANFKLFAAAAMLGMAMPLVISCDEDDTSTIGSTLTDNTVEIVRDTFYTVIGKTVTVPTIQPKSTEQLIGLISVPGYGTLRSDVVSQFLPSTVLDTANYSSANVDSLSLTLTYARGAFKGDSVAPMGLTVYELNKLLPNNINSGFDPEGFYNTTPLATKIYNTSTFLEDSEDQAAASRTIEVKLPASLGKKIYSDFEKDPASFATGQTFADNVFKGVYLKTSFGSGRMTTISATGMTFYLSKIVTSTDSVGKEVKDTVSAAHQYMLVTPEVISNNNIAYTMDEKLRTLLARDSNMVVAPAGTEMELTFPAQQIIDSYRSGTNTNSNTVLNTLSMFIPVDTLATNGIVTPPPYMLLVLKKDRDQFFAQNKLCDNKTSFYATYSSTDGGYTFSGMRNYIMDLLAKDKVEADDYTFSFVPVQVNFEAMANSGYYYYQTQYQETDIQPYLLAPVAAMVHPKEIEVILTYSKQTAK